MSARDALTLPARELARVSRRRVLGEADAPEHAGDPLLDLSRRQVTSPDKERLGDRRADAARRVERAVRVLEDSLEVRAQRAPSPSARPRDVFAVEVDRARGRPLEAEQHARERRLARARFPDEPDGLPRPDVQVDAVQRAKRLADDALPVVECDLSQLEQRCRRRQDAALGRRSSPMWMQRLT
jgi:hypothetical protein